jgi:type IV pilus assembly protein PilN
VIRTNLSTRPFYNERAVHTWLLLAAALVAVATLFNVTRVLRYSRSDTRLAGEASRDEARAGDLRQQAARLRGSVDPKQIDFASNEARRANDLIDRRTFSWTELFNKFETTLPDDVRITSVRPRLDKRGIVLSVSVVARGVDDVHTFINRLSATGAFRDLLTVEERENEAGLLESSLESIYVPGGAAAAARESTVPR